MYDLGILIAFVLGFGIPGAIYAFAWRHPAWKLHNPFLYRALVRLGLLHSPSLELLGDCPRCVRLGEEPLFRSIGDAFEIGWRLGSGEDVPAPENPFYDRAERARHRKTR